MKANNFILNMNKTVVFNIGKGVSLYVDNIIVI